MSESPAAYVVNFADNEGFAVLGADGKVAPIVAVTESGSIDPVTLSVNSISPPETQIDEGFDDSGIDWKTFDWYCPEDDDYYTMGLDTVVTDLVLGGIDCPAPTPWPSIPSPEDVAPLLSIKWNQGEWNKSGVYNKYCFKNKGGANEKNVCAGCSSTALAMIMACNEYPASLRINGTLIDWAKVKEEPDATELNAQYQEHVSLLLGGIYNNVTHIATSKGTLITPRQIKLLMKNHLGYTNLKKYNASSFTSDMLSATIAMLKDGKPVFLSAMGGSVGDKVAHSWVIDGVKYRNYNQLLHFNFGWGGHCNGYYSLTCFNPAQADSYDTDCEPDASYTHDPYGKRFRLLTYDIPSGTCSKTLNF